MNLAMNFTDRVNLREFMCSSSYVGFAQHVSVVDINGLDV